jgi:hypothetical protein
MQEKWRKRETLSLALFGQRFPLSKFGIISLSVW